MTKSGRGSARRALVAFVILGTVIVAAPTALAVPSERHDRCLVRADNYAANPHPGLTPEEIQEHTDWLYAQCAENDAAEAVAEEQGAMAPALFPNTYADRHAHPLHCLSVEDDRFGMHTNHNAANPPPDLEGPGGAAAINVPGEFMYAWIDGVPRFLIRYVVWTIDDRNGDPVTPVDIRQDPAFNETPQITVATVDFAQAYQPTSVWVEIPDTIAVAAGGAGVLQGRILGVRAWMESYCHDKRYPTNVPQLLIDRVQSLGWLNPTATELASRSIRFAADGDPNQASSWSLEEVPVVLPTEIFTRGRYRWFFDSGVTYDVDPDPPTVAADHAPGATFDGPAVTLSGTAEDSFGVDSVAVTIINTAGDYLQGDDTFSAAYSEHTTTLGTPGGASTTWSIDVSLPNDLYDLDIYARDTATNEGTEPDADFVVSDVDPDPPTVAADHAPGATFDGPAVTLSGTAEDSFGVDSVAVTIINTAGDYLQGDDTFSAAYSEHTTTLGTPGGASTTWSIDVSLPNDLYDLDIYARDTATNEGTEPDADFVVSDVDPDPPTVAADHAPGATFDGPAVTLSGTAEDSFGVDSVAVTIINTAGDYLQGDDTFSAAYSEHTTTLGTPGGASTTWSIDVSLPNDLYDLDIYARDTATNEGTEPDADFVVPPPWDSARPNPPLPDHAPFDEFAGPDITLTGTATDSVGVAQVEVSVNDRTTGLFVQEDGSFAPEIAWLAAIVTPSGDPAVTWTIDVVLPNGSYNPVARAFDDAGNSRTQTTWLPFEVGAPLDTTAPDPPLFDHAPFDEFAGPDVTLSGTAEDNVGVTSVRVRIRDRTTGLWLQTGGSFDTTAVWHNATVANPGDPAVTWTIDVVLPNGSYNPVAEAFDDAGNSRTQTTWLPFEVGAPLDTTAPDPPLFDHAPFDEFAGPDVTLSGTAEDNVGVTSVRVRIRDRTTGLWLQTGGSFDTTAVWHNATVANPGDPAVTWTIDVVLPNGSYNPVAEAFDDAGNSRTQTTWLPFEVGAPLDTTAPDPPLFDHAPFDEFAGPDVTLSGTAEDNVGVTSVRVRIRDRTTGLWLQTGGSFDTTAVWHNATVANPGDPAVTWTIDVVLPNGSYNPVAEAFDDAGNSRTQTTWLPFEVG